MSTPRRLAPMSSGTPITRMRRAGSDWAPPGEDDGPALEISVFFDMRRLLLWEVNRRPNARKKSRRRLKNAPGPGSAGEPGTPNVTAVPQKGY